VHQQERLLVREAAEWFARMHGPDAAQNDPEFLAWLAQSETHRDAFSRVSEAFSLGKNLPRDALVLPHPLPSASKTRWRKLVAASLALVIAFGGISVAIERFAIAPGTKPSPVPHMDEFATGTGVIRSVHLADGSNVILDADARIQVQFSADRRDIWLLRGRARFDVAHEARPFVVHAGGGTVTAHGTMFDVRVEHGTTSVRLLRGAIDVDLPSHGAMPSETRHISPGEAVLFAANRPIMPIPSDLGMVIDQPTWPSELLEFNRARVADVVTEANRYSKGHPIVVSPDIADMPVSGTFRVGDSDQLARNLALLLDIQVHHLTNGSIALGDKF
jgi:transmembrane sensor